jgi:hypothetical protein
MKHVLVLLALTVGTSAMAVGKNDKIDCTKVVQAVKEKKQKSDAAKEVAPKTDDKKDAKETN